MKTNSSIFYLFILFACAILSPVFGSPAPSYDAIQTQFEYHDDAHVLALHPDAQRTIDYIKDNADEINQKPVCFYSGTTRINGNKTFVLNYRGDLQSKIGKRVQILADIIQEAGLSSVGWRVTPDWDETSRALAENVSGGDVYLLLGQDIRPRSVYRRIEAPTLALNREITALYTYTLQTDGTLQ